MRCEKSDGDFLFFCKNFDSFLISESRMETPEQELWSMEKKDYFSVVLFLFISFGYF